MATFTCYICKSAAPGGPAEYRRHYLTHHASDLQAELVNR